MSGIEPSVDNPSEYLAQHLESSEWSDEQDVSAEEKFLADYPSTNESIEDFIAKGHAEFPPYQFNAKFGIIDHNEFSKNLNLDLRMIYSIFIKPREGQVDPHILQDFSLKDTSTDSAINLAEHLPPGYRVIYTPVHGTEMSMNVLGHKLILIGGDIRKLGTILTLLHELGHAKAYEALTGEQKKIIAEANKVFTRELVAVELAKAGLTDDEDLKLSKEGEELFQKLAAKYKDEDAETESINDNSSIQHDEPKPGHSVNTASAILLNWERNADAYALKTMKPFLNKVGVPELNARRVASTLHHTGLKSLSDNIRDIQALQSLDKST